MGDGWGEDAYIPRQPYFRDYPRLLVYETGVHFIDTYRYHAGEIERRGDDVAGIAVNLASRIASLAGPGQVLVSRTVTDLVVGSHHSFHPAGTRTLKGVPGEWQLFTASH